LHARSIRSTAYKPTSAPTRATARADFGDARARYRAITQTAPTDPCPRYSLALIDLAEGRSDLAIAALEPLATESENTYPLALLGHAYGRAGRRSDAMHVLERLRALESKRLVRPTDYALVYLGTGEFDRAMDWFEKATLFATRT
jgi:predicted Zn-dependent protease